MTSFSPAAPGTPATAQALRVLHVAETAQGGVGSYLEDIAALQAERYGPEALRVVMPREHAAHFRRLPPEALRPFELAGAGRLRSMLRLAVHALREIRHWQPQVVHLHSTYAGFVLRPLIAMLPARPVVVYCAHGWAFDRKGSARVNRLVAQIERLWARWSDATVCISRHDLHSARRVGIAASRLTVIANGIPDAAPVGADPEALGGWRAGSLRVLFAGRLDRQKGADVFIEAMRRLGDRADLSAVVIGSSVVAGTELADLPPAVQRIGWLPRERMQAYYEAAEVIAVPSRWEGFGLVAVEAMRSSRAVVASRVGGLVEVVDDGVTGLLIKPDSPEALSAALASLSRERVQAMGAAGRARFERLFDIRRVGDELDALYRRLLAEHQLAPRSTADPLRAG